MFEPDRLRLARDLAERSQTSIARNLGLSPAAISGYESGGLIPTDATIAALARTLKVPAAFLTAQSMGATHEGFFRSLRRTPVVKRRRARAVAEVAHELLATSSRLPAADVISLRTPGSEASVEQVEDIAGDVRRRWRVPRGPIADMVELLESHGVAVLRSALTSADVDAFSLPYPDRPVVVLGSDKDDRARSRFDAAHELGHLTMHREDVWGMKWVEDQAHWFAAGLLMPARDIRRDLPHELDWDAFFQLKRRWQVSLQALLRRSKTLETISDAQYLNGIKTISARGWRRVEPVPLGPCEQPTRSTEALRSVSVTVARRYPEQLLAQLAGAAS